MVFRWLLTFGLCFSTAAVATPRGDAKAVPGGQIVVGIPAYPKALLFYLAVDELSLLPKSLVYETLLDVDLETNDATPLLAEKWTAAKDGTGFTFTLRPDAAWSDGKPLTADDVVFTWQTIHDPKNQMAPIQAYLHSFSDCRKIDARTVQMVVRTPHFDNLRKLTAFPILPKHVAEGKELAAVFRTTLVGSGPYLLSEAVTGERLVFEKNKKWWGAKLPENRGRYNFDRIVLRAVPDQEVLFELFKKGDVDYFYFLSSKMWATQTEGEPFQKGWVRKMRVENKLPYATQGIAWNLRRPLFADRRVRRALSHLLPREKLIHDLFFDNYGVSAGVVPLKSEWHHPANIPIKYDPKEAVRLLTEAGFGEIGADGVRFKKGADGKPVRFSFELLLDNPGSERHMTRYQEELKKVGIEATLRTLDWTTRLRLLDDWQFDAAEIGRSRLLEPADFAVTWSSAEADRKGSLNHTGYKNPELDRLAAAVDRTFDKAKRRTMVRAIDRILGDDQPVTFSWEGLFLRLGYADKFSYPGKGYFAFSTWRDTFQYWWFDEGKAKRLAAARSAGKAVTGH